MPTKIKGGATLWARQTIESDVFYLKPDKWFKIWFYIVTSVNHKDRKQFKRGEGFFQYKQIMAETKANRNQIDHCIRWLKCATMITTRKATRGFIITVLKYDEFQNLKNYKSDKKSDKKSEVKATQKRHRSDTIHKNGKNDKNDKNPPLPPQGDLGELKEILKNLSSLSEARVVIQKYNLKPFYGNNQMSYDLERVKVNGQWKNFAGGIKDIHFQTLR